MISAAVSFIGEKLLDKACSGSLDKAMDFLTKDNLIKEFNKMKENIVNELENENQDETFYEDLQKLIKGTRIVDLMFNLSYTITSLTMEERRKCLVDRISDYLKANGVSTYNAFSIQDKILLKFEGCFEQINSPNEESRKVINSILLRMINSDEIIDGINSVVSTGLSQIKEELEVLKSKLLTGDVDLKYLSDLTNSSFENLRVRFNKKFNVDVELTDKLGKFCKTKEAIASLYTELKEIKKYIIQLTKLVDSGLISKVDALIENILGEKDYEYTLLKEDFDNYSEAVYKELDRKYEKKKDSLYNSNEYYYFREFVHVNNNLDKYRKTFEPYTLIVTGSAGIGKSHSIAYFCNEVFYMNNKTCIFILGQHLNELGNPIEMIERALHIPYTLQRFLDELEKLAQFNKTVVPFVIEGINEGRHSEVWRESFAGFISIFKRYKWIRLIISIRSTYIEKCLPSNFQERDEVLVIEHNGFEDNSIQAVKRFFEFYEIPIPTFPVLYAEFHNPLFLHTLCKTLKKFGTCRTVNEYSSFNYVFEKYLDVIEDEIARKMDYIKSLKIVKRVAYRIVEYSLKNNNKYGIDLAKFYGLVQDITNQYQLNCNTFVQLLFKEGLFYSEIYVDDSEEYVQFAYERYHNMLAARYILNGLSTKDELVISLKDGMLKEYMKKPQNGITEELFIMIPDRFDVEPLSLISEELALKNLDNYINSLLWRNKNNIRIKETKDFLNKYVVRRKYYSDKFLKTLFVLSPVEKHPLNVLFLQEYLNKMTMAFRDAYLADVLYEVLGVNATLRNLVSFCFTSGIDSCSEESIMLMSYMLSWSLASTNLKYRNSVIRALVILFDENIELIKNVIINFKHVDDPYIREGVYCAAYGAVLRSVSFPSGMTGLIDEVYNDIFSSSEVYPNILVRDHARGIIEYANICGINISFDLEKIRPPYKSCWYKNIPTQQEIDDMNYDYRDEDLDRRVFAVNNIISSMTTNTGSKHMMYGDFGRYVFEGWVRPWNYHFVEQDLSNIATKEILTTLGYNPKLHGEFDLRVRSSDRQYHECERIGKKYQRIASYELIARLSDNFPAGKVEYLYDKEYLKVHKSKLEQFVMGLYQATDDRKQDNDASEENSLVNAQVAEEEIGDEYENYRREVFKELPYEGSWQIGVREIDPTIVVKNHIASEKNYLESIFEIPLVSAEEWAGCNSCEPSEKDILFLKAHDDEFVVLEMYNTWKSNRYKLNDKPHEYFVKAIALFVDRERAQELLDDEQIKEFCSNENNYELHDIYAREYPWAPSYLSFKNEIKSDYSEELKCYIDTGICYHSDNPNPMNEDYEVKSFSMPSDYIIDKLGLRQIEDGKWFDKEGTLVAYDMVFEGYQSMLVINHKSLMKLLDENNLAVLWGMYTEKSGEKYHYSKRQVVGLIKNNLERNVFDEEVWESRFDY